MKRRAGSARRVWVKRGLLGVLFLSLIASVWAYTVARSFTSNGGGITEVWEGIANPRGLFPEDKDRVVILVVGKDYNHDKKGMPYTKEARSDTIMLISADLEGGKLATLSIPRDTRVEDEEGVHKINAMFKNGGIQLLKRTLLREFGIYPDYHVILKDQAVKELVNAVGGVEVEAIDDMFYEDSWGGLHIDIKKGRQRLDGEQAIGFVRFRKMGTHKIVDGQKVDIDSKSSLEEGDIRRTERQQQLVRALGSEALAPRNIVRAPSIVNTGFQQIETDLSRPQVLALATLFKGKSLSGSVSATIPGEDSKPGDTYFWIPDKERTALMVKWMLHGDEAAGRQMVRVIVFNGSETRGAARTAGSLIEQDGFDVQIGGNKSTEAAQTTVLYRKAMHEAYAREIATRLGGATVSKDTGEKGDWRPEIEVVIGKTDGERFAPTESN